MLTGGVCDNHAKIVEICYDKQQQKTLLFLAKDCGGKYLGGKKLILLIQGYVRSIIEKYINYIDSESPIVIQLANIISRYFVRVKLEIAERLYSQELRNFFIERYGSLSLDEMTFENKIKLLYYNDLVGLKSLSSFGEAFLNSLQSEKEKEKLIDCCINFPKDILIDIDNNNNNNDIDNDNDNGEDSKDSAWLKSDFVKSVKNYIIFYSKWSDLDAQKMIEIIRKSNYNLLQISCLIGNTQTMQFLLQYVPGYGTIENNRGHESDCICIPCDTKRWRLAKIRKKVKKNKDKSDMVDISIDTTDIDGNINNDNMDVVNYNQDSLINIKNNNIWGHTAFYIACRYKNWRCIQMLLAYDQSCDITLAANDGSTSLDAAFDKTSTLYHGYRRNYCTCLLLTTQTVYNRFIARQTKEKMVGKDNVYIKALHQHIWMMNKKIAIMILKVLFNQIPIDNVNQFKDNFDGIVKDWCDIHKFEHVKKRYDENGQLNPPAKIVSRLKKIVNAKSAHNMDAKFHIFRGCLFR